MDSILIVQIIKLGRSIVGRSFMVVSVAAILGACVSAIASSSLSGYTLYDVVMEADGGSITISADQITLSVQLIPVTIDHKNIVIQEISKMQAVNLRVRKVDADRVIETRAARASGYGIVQKVDVDKLEDVGVGFFLKLLVAENRSLQVKNQIVKNLELQAEYISTHSITIYGLETSIG